MSTIYVTPTTVLTAAQVGSGCNVIASGGLFSITLPDPTTVPDGCEIVIKNNDKGNSKTLIGAPDDANKRLYPKQAIRLATSNGAWVVLENPGRVRITQDDYVVYLADAAHGGSDSNDGMTPSTPLLNTQTACQMIQQDFDIRQITPYIAILAGSTVDPILLGGQPTGGNLIGLCVYGQGAATIKSNDWAGVVIGDNAEIDIRVNALTPSGASLILQGNQADHASNAAGVYQHNNGLFDQEGDVTIIGNGPNGSAYFFDGPCPGASIADGFKVGGVFGDIFRMDEGGGRYSLGGVIQPVTWNGSACSAARLFGIYGENELLIGGSMSGGYASLGMSLVGGNALMVTNGMTIPGGVTTSQGGRVAATKF